MRAGRHVAGNADQADLPHPAMRTQKTTRDSLLNAPSRAASIRYRSDGIAPGEWRYAIGLALLAILLTSLPYLVGWFTVEPGEVFGGFVIDAQDAYSHVAKMQLGRQGSWKFRILFTPEPHKGSYIYPFYLALGHLSRWLHVNVIAMYHLARVIAGLFLLLTAYRFTSFFLREPGHRRIAYFLICFSSGLGWLMVLLSGSFVVDGITPVDFWLIEISTFFTIMIFPHTAVAVALMLVALPGVAGYLDSRRTGGLLPSIVAVLGIAIIHPYLLLVVNLVLAGYWLSRIYRQRELALAPLAILLLVMALPIPVVLYQYVELVGNPVFVGWQAQNHTLSPPPLHYVVGYGVVLLLAIPGMWWALRQPARTPLLPLWVLVVAPLLYAPSVFSIERRFLEGLHVPLAVLAGAGFVHYLLPVVRDDRRLRFGGLLLLGLSLPSSLLLLAQAVLLPLLDAPNSIYTPGEMAAFHWLAAHSNEDDVILSSYEIGSALPAYTGRRVFMGHWTETIDLAQKRAQAHTFFDGGAPAARRRLITEYGITYLFYGPRERALGSFDPAMAGYLTPVFHSGAVTLYRTQRDGAQQHGGRTPLTCRAVD